MSNYKLTVKFLAIIKEPFVTHDIRKSVLYIIILLLLLLLLIIIIILIMIIFIQEAHFTKSDIQ